MNYVALLRGINVSGHHVIKMTELRELLTSLNFYQVKTYIQSGNIVFSCDKSVGLEKMICNAIETRFSIHVPVLIRSKPELERIIRNNPWLHFPEISENHLHITFLSKAPVKDKLPDLTDMVSDGDSAKLKNQEIFLHCPSGYGKTRFHNTFFERKFNCTATTRNWKTVNTLYGMMND